MNEVHITIYDDESSLLVTKVEFGFKEKLLMLFNKSTTLVLNTKRVFVEGKQIKGGKSK